MPEQAATMSDSEFERLCLDLTYQALAVNPARYNLAPVPLISPPGEEPRLTCPGCLKTFAILQPGYVQSCSHCDAGILIVDTANSQKPGKRRRKKG